MILSILIPTLYERAELFNAMKSELERQIAECNAVGQVEILVNVDNREKPTGRKRNELLKEANGEYVVFVDDDDEIPNYYVGEILEAAKGKADCMAINGTYSENGGVPIKWEIAIANPYEKIGDIIYRYPNHITPIKREKAVKFSFPDKTFGEDYEWATQIHQSGVLKTEVKINRPMYHYKFISKK